MSAHLTPRCPLDGLTGQPISDPCPTCSHLIGMHEYPTGICAACAATDATSIDDRLTRIEHRLNQLEQQQ